MSKLTDLEKALQQATDGGTAVVRLQPAPQPQSSPSPAALKRPARNRVHLGAYLHPDFKKGILMLRVATGEDFQTLLARMLNEQFRLHGLPIINPNAD
jgi:hypothetical protein